MASDYPVGFYFSLSFEGEDAAFQEVSGLSKEFAFEDIVCGGENRFKYRLPTIVTGSNLVLKRAIVPTGSQLIEWIASAVDGGLVNNVVTHDVSVSLLGAGGAMLMMWTFRNAYPLKYSVSDLRSQDNSLVIESMELAYTYFEITQEDDNMFGNLFD